MLFIIFVCGINFAATTSSQITFEDSVDLQEYRKVTEFIEFCVQMFFFLNYKWKLVDQLAGALVEIFGEF